MAEIIPMLTLETLAKYLKEKEVGLEIENKDGNRFIPNGSLKWAMQP